MRTKTEQLKELLFDWGFREDVCEKSPSLSQNYVHFFIEEDGVVICKYIPPHNIRRTEWSANIKDEDFGIRFYSTVFFSRIEFHYHNFAIMRYLLQLKFADGGIDSLEIVFSLTSCKGKKIKEQSMIYNLDKKYFLKQITSIVTNHD
ncbi:hypothetical protein EZS27_014187 [termite gut metagenome]|uniref:Uncharacterized protein n=1 Tax=termite gut metagenome TaxID=433724 RepID=A0A5J4RW07_9ZZZZ